MSISGSLSVTRTVRIFPVGIRFVRGTRSGTRVSPERPLSAQIRHPPRNRGSSTRTHLGRVIRTLPAAGPKQSSGGDTFLCLSRARLLLRYQQRRPAACGQCARCRDGVPQLRDGQPPGGKLGTYEGAAPCVKLASAPLTAKTLRLAAIAAPTKGTIAPGAALAFPPPRPIARRHSASS